MKAPGLLGEGGSATIAAGRFVVNLGSRRLIAADDYRVPPTAIPGCKRTLDGVGVGTRRCSIPCRSNVGPTTRRGCAARLLRSHGRGWRPHPMGPATAEASFFHLDERDQPGRPSRDRSLDIAKAGFMRDPVPAKLDREVEAIIQRGQLLAAWPSPRGDRRCGHGSSMPVRATPSAIDRRRRRRSTMTMRAESGRAGAMAVRSAVRDASRRSCACRALQRDAAQHSGKSQIHSAWQARRSQNQCQHEPDKQATSDKENQGNVD